MCISLILHFDKALSGGRGSHNGQEELDKEEKDPENGEENGEWAEVALEFFPHPAQQNTQRTTIDSGHD